MEKTSEFLIYLMACSLQGTKPEEALLANIDMEALLRLAKAHSVSAMVCMALEQTDAFQHAAETTRLKWLDCKNKAVRKNMLLDAERHRLEKEFAEHGIWYMPLKGSILKDWYPKFGMREMADNDILFDATRRQQVRDIFVNRGYSIESYNKSSNHDAYEKQPIYNFEMHVALFHEDCSTLQKKYENAVQHVPRFPSGHGHVLHRRGRLGCGELCLCTHFTGFCTKLVEVIPGRTGNGRNLAHLGIEVGCGLHCGSAKTRYSGSHRQELLTDILHRRSNVLELFSGFIDLSKCRIGSSRLVL